jgi:TPP-dependent pyruvate/acetoin dehydrogenase alpha subunit
MTGVEPAAPAGSGLRHSLYRQMLLIRRFEERVYRLFLEGEIPGTLPAIAIVGAGNTVVTSLGLAMKLRRSRQVAVCFFGDGATNEGARRHTACPRGSSTAWT